MEDREILDLARIRAILNSALSGIVTIDRHGIVESYNAAAERMFGYAEDEVMGRNISLLMPPPYREEHDGYLAAYLETGKAKVIGVGREVQALRKDGTIFPMSLGISEFQEGGERFFTAILQDITEQKQAMVDASVSEAFARAVLNSMSAEIAVLDREGKIIAVNEAWRRLSKQGGVDWVGHELKTHVGVNYLHVCRESVGETAEGAKKATEGILAVLEGRAPSFSLEYPCQFDEKCLWFMMNVTPLGCERGGVVVSHAEISERRQAEDSLRESEERLRLLGDNLPDSAVYQYAHESGGKVRFHYVSSGIERLNGVSVTEVLGDAGALHRQIPSDYLTQLVQAEERSARDLSDFEMELPMRRPDGQLRWMRLHSRPRRFPNGWTLWDGVQTDVTERREMEQHLRDHEQRHRFALETLGVGEWELNLATHTMERSLLHDQIFGYEALLPEWTYEHFLEHVLPGERETVDGLFRRAVEASGIWDFECRIRRLDGAIRWIHARSQPRTNQAGEALLIGIVEDITERKLAEYSLRESQERLSLVLEAAEIGTWDWDLHADFIHCSSRTLALFGLPPGTPMDYGRFVESLHAEDREPVTQAIQSALNGREDYQVEMRTVWPDGSLHWVASRGRVYFDAAGRPVRMSGAALDLTEDKRVERQLRERQMEAENSMRLCVANQTIAAIAHELNQPLNAIATYSAGALRLVKAGNPPLEKLALALEQNAKQALRAGRVIRELLDFLRGNEVAMEVFELDRLVRQSVDHLQKDGLLGDFKTTLELPGPLQAVQANRIQVEKVLANLLRNAVEAMQGAGLANDRVWVCVRAAGKGCSAQVTVRDSGPGLDEGSVSRVFEPFYTTKPRGLGMGLAISRALIEAQGGELWAERTGGRGAVFHFTLPFAPEAS